MSSGLSGLRVQILRSPRPGDPLAEQLQFAGAVVENCPVLSIQRCEIDPRIVADSYDKAIFVSRHAVSFGLEGLRLAGLDFRGMEVAAVGPTTAAVLGGHGIEAFYPLEQVSTEGLLDLPQLRSVAGQKILIVRGCGGREYLKNALTRRGADVRYCEVYRREVDFSCLHSVQAFLDKGTSASSARALVIHSSEIAAAYVKLLDSVDVSSRCLALSLPCLTPSSRVAGSARALGFEKVLEASSAIARDMVEALRYWYT